MRTVAIIQARMGSTRLPGKILLPLGVKSVLEVVLQRVQSAKQLDEIVIATSTNELDEPVEALCKDWGILCVRGSEQDVMDRFYQASISSKASDIIRITADCPLVDPSSIDELILIHKSTQRQFDYILKEGMPIGTTAELFTFEALKTARALTGQKHHREHIVTAFTDMKDRFRNLIFYSTGIEYAPELRLTLDTKEDYELLRRIFDQQAAKADSNIAIADVINYLRLNRHLLEINSRIKQKAPHETEL
jgi:spore coat polysaccharide biosynthesis protein SpsF